MYRVIIVNPEIALGVDSIFERVWKSELVRSRITSIVWDEAHCVEDWSSFRLDYRDGARLRIGLGRQIPFYAASATLPEDVLIKVMQHLGMQRDSTKLVERSNDRPNVYLTVRRIQHALNSFEDLDFLIPKNWVPGQPLPKFIVFFDDITESVAAAKRLRSRLPLEHRHLIKWFNADMTASFRERHTELYKEGENLRGMCSTDSFGVVSAAT